MPKAGLCTVRRLEVRKYNPSTEKKFETSNEDRPCWPMVSFVFIGFMLRMYLSTLNHAFLMAYASFVER